MMADSGTIDLGLKIPDGFTPAPLFPGDRLLRLHPNWFVSDFVHQADQGFSANIRDYATDDSFLLRGGVEYGNGKDDFLEIRLDAPFDTCIRFSITAGQLRVQVRSPGVIEAEDPLLLWVKAVREYIRLYTRTNPLTLLFRVLMNRMVLRMNPSQRKISLMIARFTALEILVILLIVAGYVIFVL